MKSKFIEADLVVKDNSEVEPPIVFHVRLNEIKKILPHNNKCCLFYLYKDEVYLARISANELLALINENS